MKILIGNKIKTRIFHPWEIAEMRKVMKISDRTIFDMCFMLGARYEECRRIQLNPDHYDGNFVHVDERKIKRTCKQRFIRLTPRCKNMIDYFFESKPMPTVQVFDIKLKRWARMSNIGAEGVSARSLRKTWESWLVFCYPIHTALIYGSQGHTELTSLQYYTSLPFTNDEKKDMIQWVDGYV